MPCLKDHRTVTRARDRACQVSGIRHLNEDGSAVVAWTYLDVIRRSIISKGAPWIKARGCKVEALVAGDAVQCGEKWTHLTARVMGVFRDANSPLALWGMVHYLGGDDWEPLHEQCQGIFDAIRSLQQAGNKITITFPATATTAAEDVEVSVRTLLCADGAMLDAEEGGSGFTGDYPCVICQVAKRDLLDEKKVNTKYTTAILNNLSHLPACWPCSDEDFVPFSYSKCKKKFNGIKDCTDEPELDKVKQRKYKRQHNGQIHHHYKLFPSLMEDTILCTLHVCLAYVRHGWTHAIAQYISGPHGDDIADFINNLLHEKCGVEINTHKVNGNLKQDAARMPRLPGAAARKVTEHFDLILKAVLYWDDEYLDCQERKQHYERSVECNDALINLWNTLTLKMEPQGPGLPPSLETREKKAKLIGIQAKLYRMKFKKAYNATAGKPYTHMSTHLEEMQMKLEWDLVDYSGQAQEHYGKLCKSIVRHQCNHQLAKTKKDGTKSASKVMQVAKNMMHRQHLMSIEPVPATDYSARKVQKISEGKEAYQMMKAEAFPESKVPLSKRVTETPT